MLRFLARVTFLLGMILLALFMTVVGLFLLAPALFIEVAQAFNLATGYGQAAFIRSASRLALIGGPLFVLGVLFCLALLGWRLLGNEPAAPGRKAAADESRMTQEIYHGLSRVEERVEALETILLSSRRHALHVEGANSSAPQGRRRER